MPPKRPDPGWNVQEALQQLRARIDPYIWDQGQELFRRGAVEDVQMAAEGVIHVRVIDPRDTRKFFVAVERMRDGKVVARCPCPYRLGGYCRHQVVGLEYLKQLALGGAAPEAPPAPPPAREVKPAPAGPAPRLEDVPPPAAQGEAGPILYRLFEPSGGVAAQPDGSLLRVVLLGLGSSGSPHRLGLQLFTGTGWTEVRTPDVERWIHRGEAGQHPRDAALAAYFTGGGNLVREAGSELFAAILSVLAGSTALVERSGRALPVSRWPYKLAARLTRGTEEGVDVQLYCRSPAGEELPFEEVAIVASSSPWIQLESGAFHPLEAAATGRTLAELQLASLGSIAGAELDRLLTAGTQQLERLCGGDLSVAEGLIEQVEGVSGARIRLSGDEKRLRGKLELCYGGKWVDAPDTPEPWTVEENGRITRYPPAGQSLSRAHRELESVGFRRGAEGWMLERAGALGAVLAPRERPFVAMELPERLEALNLTEREPILRLRVSAPGGAGGGAAAGPGGTPRASSGIAWLEVTAELLDGTRQVPYDLTALAEARSVNERGVLQLGDGTVLGLGHQAVESLLDVARLAGALEEGARRSAGGARNQLRVPLNAVGELLDEVPSREVEFGLELKGLIESIKGGKALEAAALRDGLGDRLRPYQREAVRWFGELGAWGLAGILADEMGLGKTVMALTHLFGRSEPPRDRAPVLVVCPSSLVFNWIDETQRFFPGVTARGLHGREPAEREALIKEGADLLITSYALLRRDREAFEARELRAVVLDEAQHIKNADSQTAQAACALRAPERWILTGTPIENHVGELWSLFHFLMPGFLGSRPEFDERYRGPIAQREEDALDKLRARVRPFILRRTKSQVLTELPPRIEQVERVPMTAAQRKIYDTYLLAARGELEGADEKEARFQILAALTRLRQICCHPRLVLEDRAIADLGVEPSELTGAKFELLLELLEECIEEGHRVLLYSQFTTMLDLIEERLVALGIPRCRLDGSTRDREAQVKRFTGDPSIPVFLISLKAGGFGLNLTQADTVIIYDPWWNPAAEDQAAARAHRMGQTLPVHVHKLITAGTVEEKILELQASKRDLAGKVVDSDEPLGALSLRELKSILYET